MDKRNFEENNNFSSMISKNQNYFKCMQLMNVEFMFPAVGDASRMFHLLH